jgi:Camelysin metallo-endopeptidase
MQRFGSIARHRAHGFRPTIRGMLISTVAIAAGSALAVFAAGGSYAKWNSGGAITSTVITAGSLGLTVNNAATVALSGASWSTLLPGDVVSQQVSLKNTGTVPGVVTVSTTGSFGTLLVHAKKGACGATITGTSSTVSPTNIGVFAGGEVSVVCLQVTLPSSVANGVQGSSMNFTTTFTATTQ